MKPEDKVEVEGYNKAADRENAERKWMLAGLLVIVLFFASPFIWMVGSMKKANRDVRLAQEEFKRSAKPDELRAWVFAQLKKNPQEGYSEESAKEWPRNFPRIRGKRFKVYLSPSSGGQGIQGVQSAYLVWDFYDQGLKVSVFLKPDGSPADFEDDEPWAKGVTFDHLHK